MEAKALISSACHGSLLTLYTDMEAKASISSTKDREIISLLEKLILQSKMASKHKNMHQEHDNWTPLAPQKTKEYCQRAT